MTTKSELESKLKERTSLKLQRAELESQYQEWMFNALPEDVQTRLKEIEQERNQLLDQVAEIQADLEAEMNTALENADKTISTLEEEIKAGVVELGESVKVKGLGSCVYSQGRTTFETEPLVKLAKKHEFLRSLMKEGKPYAYFR